jgi:uncharacterized protein (TIGR04168 family)
VEACEPTPPTLLMRHALLNTGLALITAQRAAGAAAARPAAVAVASRRMAAAAAAGSCTLAVVGDVHDQWDAGDARALAALAAAGLADLAVFLGDFGEEKLELVRALAALEAPARRAAILGNHDAWYSLTERGRARATRVATQSASLAARAAAALALSPRHGGVKAQLDALGDAHLGLRSTHFPELGLGLVGARPFSRGGRRWDDLAVFYKEVLDIGGFEDAARAIAAAAAALPPGAPTVVIAHNGPAGLGGRRSSPCGVDWQPQEGDHGDPDLERALEAMAAVGRPARLCLFGHMHHELRGGGRRDMAAVDAETGAIFLNAAVVPRWRMYVTGGGLRRRGSHFLLVEMRGGEAVAARNVFVASGADVAAGEGGAPPPLEIIAEEWLLKAPAGADGARRVANFYRASADEWTSVVLPQPSGAAAPEQAAAS